MATSDGGCGDVQILTLDEAAEYLKIPKQTLYQWRIKGYGPAGIKVGRWVRYRRADIDDWLDKRAAA